MIPRRTFLKGLGLATIVGAFCPLELAPKSIATPSRELVTDVPLPLVLLIRNESLDLELTARMAEKPAFYRFDYYGNPE